MLFGYVKFIVFGSACSQYAAIVKELLKNTKMLNVLTGEQIVTHKIKPAHHVRGRKRRGEGEEGGGGEEKEANKQIEEEADDVLKGKMLCL